MSKKRIPPRDMVASIMKEVLQQRRVISTLNELWLIVLVNLKKINKKFVISRQRIKHIAVQVPGIEVKAKTKSGGKRKITVCPLCNSELSDIYGKNLLGRRMHTGYKCRRCNYRAGVKMFVPRKYIFIRKPV